VVARTRAAQGRQVKGAIIHRDKTGAAGQRFGLALVLAKEIFSQHRAGTEVAGSRKAGLETHDEIHFGSFLVQTDYAVMLRGSV
jgi:hypothetical protein